VTLRALLAGEDVQVVRGPLDIDIHGLCVDSRRARPGDAFFALSGARADGKAFARDAARAGALAVVGDAEPIDGVTTVGVEEPRRALARAAATFHGTPALALVIAAVTGTNGKTTTTYLLESIFEAAGWPAGLVGTTGARLRGELRRGELTTPGAPELYALLAEMRDRGLKAVALEVSSHALVQRRAWGLHSDVAIFTNLSHDHLDYHGTLEAYLDAKLMLFDGRNGDHDRKPWTAVVNLDDEAAPRVLAAAERGGGARRTFGAAAEAEVRIESVEPRARGIAVRLLERGGTPVALDLPLLGRYNGWNAAGAYAAARALRLEPATIVRGLAATQGVPGRLERVDRGQPFEVVVDYAHTPDALRKALAAAREHATGRLLLVFGCGGDRDRAKRPAMGRVAAEEADEVWVTSDNPRSEDPAAIAREIVTGMEPRGGRVVLDRRAAIAEAIAQASAGDLVLIAGKGHEITQTIGDRVLPFDDRQVAGELLAAGSAR
jgi:UDP-N-acetylmuramoyl-L-alanyl-D-glutamate--2,6-diaminopimelate ligase